MIDPRTQYILYKERENQLMAQIERKQAELERCESRAISQSWYSVVVQWLKKKLFSHRKYTLPRKNPEIMKAKG
jgi:hypothetical protein